MAQDDDLTGKIQQVVHSETSKPFEMLEKRAKSLKFWFILFGMIFVAGGSWTAYATSFAKQSVVEKLTARTEQIANDLSEHKKVEEQKLQGIADNQKRTEEDYHLLLKQTMEIARATGARRYEMPEHVKEGMQ